MLGRRNGNANVSLRRSLFRTGKAWAIIISIGLLLNSLILPFTTREASAETAVTPPSLTVIAEAAILMDAETGQILFEHNKDELRHPASMVKMMTEYLVMEAISNGTIAWDQMVTVSKYADGIGGSGQLIAEGHQYSVEDLVKQMSIYSSNDATVALAELVGGGTEEAFVRMMNDKAREFGLSEGATFTNATGLNKDDTGEFTPNIPGESMFTAHDAAIIAQRVIKDHPQILEYSSIPTAPAWENGPVMTNWNRILEGWKAYNNNFSAGAYEGLDGLKTGHTDEAGWCFTGTAQRGNIRLISVVMGTDSEQARFDETKKLMDYGFNNFERKTILSPKTKVEAMPIISVPKGKETKMDVVTGSGVEYLVLKGTSDDAFAITAEELPEADRTAPITAGQSLGQATITYSGASIGIPETTTVDLIATKDMEKAGWFALFMRAIGDFFRDLFGSIKNLF